MNFIEMVGGQKSLLVTDTNAVTSKNLSAIQVIEDSVFSVLTSATMSVQGAIADASFAAGTVIFGNFTAFTLTSGAVIAYNAL